MSRARVGPNDGPSVILVATGVHPSTQRPPFLRPESMFYLYLLAFPMLLPLLLDLATQKGQLNTIGLRADFSFPLPTPTFVNITSVPLLSIIPLHPLPSSPNPSFLTIGKPLYFTNISIFIKIKSLDSLLRLPTFSFNVYTTYLSTPRL